MKEKKTAGKSPKNKQKRIALALRIATGVLCGIVILFFLLCAYLFLARVAGGNPYPTVFGYGHAVAASNVMEPDIHEKDLIITKKLAPSEYEAGDIVIYIEQPDSRIVTQRIALAREDSLIMEDGNTLVLGPSVDISDVQGKVVKVLPGAGAVLNFFRSPGGVIVLLAIGGILYMAPTLVKNMLGKREPENTEEEKTIDQ